MAGAVTDTTDASRSSDDPSTTDTVDEGYDDGLVADIREVVFTSPTQAWVRFHTYDYDQGQDSFAVVELTGDTWKLTHDSACGILSSTDGWCDGDWTTVLPPSATNDPRYADQGHEYGVDTVQTDATVVTPRADLDAPVSRQARSPASSRNWTHHRAVAGTYLSAA